MRHLYVMYLVPVSNLLRFTPLRTYNTARKINVYIDRIRAAINGLSTSSALTMLAVFFTEWLVSTYEPMRPYSIEEQYRRKWSIIVKVLLKSKNCF
jgi:hypothetical protein